MIKKKRLLVVLMIIPTFCLSSTQAVAMLPPSVELTSIIVAESEGYYSIAPERLDELGYQVTNVHPGFYRYRARTCNTDSCTHWTYSQVLHANYQQLNQKAKSYALQQQGRLA